MRLTWTWKSISIRKRSSEKWHCFRRCSESLVTWKQNVWNTSAQGSCSNDRTALSQWATPCSPSLLASPPANTPPRLAEHNCPNELLERLALSHFLKGKKIPGWILWIKRLPMGLAGLPGGSVGKNPSASAGDPGSSRGPRRCSCLENPTDGGAWRAVVHGAQRVKHDKSNVTKQQHQK